MAKEKARRHRKRVRRKRQSAELRRYEHVAEEGIARLEDRARNDWPVPQAPIYRREGAHKVSQAVLELIDDELEVCDSEAQIRAAIDMGVLAWNIAVLGPKAPEFLRETVVEMGKHSPKQAVELIELYLLSVADRKKEMFPDYREFIFDYELTMEGDYRHLAVMTMPAMEAASLL